MPHANIVVKISHDFLSSKKCTPTRQGTWPDSTSEKECRNLMEAFPYVQLYSYAPLSEHNREIRLLQLLPATECDDSPHEPIECSILIATLDSAPKYYALSYAWGSSREMKPLLADGKLLEITANLDTALRQLRETEYGQLNSIWIDAVCINQADDCEKSWQVEAMANIYSQAACTLAWLGPADHELSIAINTIKELFADLSDGQNGCFDRFAAKLEHSESVTRPDEYKSLSKFLRLQYFRRLWILQEVTFSNEVRILCGSFQLPWNMLNAVLEAYVEAFRQSMSKTLSGSDTLVEMVKEGYRNGKLCSLGPIKLPSVFRIGACGQKSLQLFSLGSLLWRSKFHTDCSDPRDYVYSLLGLAENSRAMGLRPNYDVTTQDCFIEATKALSLVEGLGVLSMCHQSKTIRSLPSWVPDFASRWSPNNSLLGPGPYIYAAKLDDMKESFYTASYGTFPSMSFEKVGAKDIMTIEGAVCGSVARTMMDTSPYSTGGLTNSLFNLTDAMLAAGKLFLLLNAPSKNRTYGSMFSTIARVARRDEEPGLLKVPLTKDTHAADISLLAKLWVLLNIESGSAPSRPTTDDVLEHSNQAFSLVSGLEQHLFVTTNGNLGISARELQADDVVAILYGAKVPYILRETECGFYQLICEAFINGMMYGEALKGNREIINFKLY